MLQAGPTLDLCVTACPQETLGIKLNSGSSPWIPLLDGGGPGRLSMQVTGRDVTGLSNKNALFPPGLDAYG